MPRSVHPFVQREDQAWQERKGTDQTDQYALGENDPHIDPDSVSHERKRGKPDDCGQRTGYHRASGIRQSQDHGIVRTPSHVRILSVPMQYKDEIIDGYTHLEYTCGSICHG